MEDSKLNDIREKIGDLVDTAEQRRIPFYEVQSVFKSVKNSLSGRKFSQLKTKLGGEFDITKLEKLHESLLDLVRNHIGFDDKLIFIFKSAKGIQSQLNKYLKNEVGNYKLFDRKDLGESRIFYQFLICREINVKVQLSVSDLRDSEANYQEVYAIEKIPLNCHDFIMTDNEKVVIGIDLASVLGINELNIVENDFFNFLKKDAKIELQERVDFFSKIREFYDLPQDNTNGVTEISFITTAGTAHHEVLRGNATDLRQAPYHYGGVKAVRKEKSNGRLLNNDINPYKINSRFYRNIGNDIDIAIKSSYRALNTANASHVYGAFIYGARSLSDLDFAISRLTS